MKISFSYFGDAVTEGGGESYFPPLGMLHITYIRSQCKTQLRDPRVATVNRKLRLFCSCISVKFIFNKYTIYSIHRVFRKTSDSSVLLKKEWRPQP